MLKLESQIKTLKVPEETVYRMLSDFRNFDRMAHDQEIEGWQSTQDNCRFRVKYMGNVGIRIVDRRQFDTIKMEGEGNVPFRFTFWIQLKQLDYYDTKMRLTMHARLNFILKLFMKRSLKKFINELADSFATSFNSYR